MESVQWYLRRLKVMSLGEIARRAAEPARLGFLKLEKRARRRREQSADWRRFAFCIAGIPQLPQLPCAFSPNAEKRERLLAGEWGALGFAWRWQAGGHVWHTAPDTGRAWPAAFFGSISYRAGNPHGDVRVVWEPARLQGLVELALLARHEPACRTRAAQLAEQVLHSWVRENPYLTGPHYISAMECALRLIAVCHALDMMRGLNLRDESWGRVAWLVPAHAALIIRRLSLHSSSGNHLIAECAGLIYAGVLFAEDPRAADWLDKGLAILTREAGRQVLTDGGGIEQAPHYQLFIIDLLGLVMRLLESRGQPCPQAIVAAVMRGRRFLGTLATGMEDLPPIGDADSGVALTPYLRISFESMQDAAGVTTFPEAGYTISRSPDAAGLRIVIDHGPLGMPPSYGHGHADALSVCAALDGAPFLIDPGTYGYNLGARWRRYFRSTRAHNTVVVDALDQAVQAGAFLWTQPYAARSCGPRGGDDHSLRLILRHNGYERAGVTHWRSLLVRRDGVLVVWDRLTGRGAHELELNWHLGQEPSAVAIGAACLTFANGYLIEVWGGESSLHRGEDDPPRGWQSLRYGMKSPATTWRTRWSGRVPHEFITVVRPGDAAVDTAACVEELRSLQACREQSA